MENRILKMRKENNSYVSTLLNEAIQWNSCLDEVVVLCDVLRILDQNNIRTHMGERSSARKTGRNETG